MTARANTLGRVFITYRREDTSGTAGRLYDRLAARIGSDKVFMDVDSIAPGYDFANAIENAVASCNVVVALIGKRWFTAVNENGWRRLDDPNDFVVLEIRAGLSRRIPVIPVLVDGAPQIREHHLPAHLAELARRQSVRLDHESFSVDVNKLIGVLERVFATSDIGPHGLSRHHPGMPGPVSNSNSSTMRPHDLPQNPPLSQKSPNLRGDDISRGAPPPRRRATLIWIALALLVIFGGVGSAAWYFTRGTTTSVSANVGDCVTQAGGNTLAKVNCSDRTARFKVIGRVENQTISQAGSSACTAFPQTITAYWEGESGKTGTVLCLGPVT